jgi:multidrug efflux pump subunit AcrA (membrane-fusion protein)
MKEGKTGFQAFTLVYRYNKKSNIHKWLLGLLIAMAIILFLPWTQNIRSRGAVTTLLQEHRPQQVNTIIGGKVVKWHIKEGDFVNAGDTILQLAEVKDAYLDPQLLNRTQEQLAAKQQSMEYYQSKAGASGIQISALQSALQLKQEQLQNKLRQIELKTQSDSMELIAANNDLAIALQQLNRQKVLFDSGLVSLTQLEQRNQQYQNAMAKKISAANKLANTRQDYTITQIEINSTGQEYTEKISKAESDRLQSLSEIATGQGEVAKLQNQYTNYNIRNGLYYITAPQSGQVVRARKAGIGEVVKEGEMLLEIVPDKIQYAVEMFVRPVDLPLISKGQKVRFIFDGFPAIIFSGWPEASYGTFGGVIAAVESSADNSGKFRVLVVEDKKEKPWPIELKIGTGVQAMALLKNVPVWYELWRNINGFPPDYYKTVIENTAKK